MKLSMKKMLFGLGSLTAIVAPVAAVVACDNDDSTSKNAYTAKLNGTTVEVTIANSKTKATLADLAKTIFTTSKGTATSAVFSMDKTTDKATATFDADAKESDILAALKTTFASSTTLALCVELAA